MSWLLIPEVWLPPRAAPSPEEERIPIVFVEPTVLPTPTPSPTATPEIAVLDESAPPEGEGQGGGSSSSPGEPATVSHGDPSAEDAGDGGDIQQSVRSYYEAERKRVLSGEERDPDDPLVLWERSPTDSIDGIPRLGSGDPGDPRIPGSGGVDIAKVISHDARVNTGKLRAQEGQIHPFVAALKREIEKGWRPDGQDIRAIKKITKGESVRDPVCARGAHDRYLVARVFVTYGSDGTPLDYNISGSTVSRDIKGRILRAVREPRLRDRIPPTILNAEGTLHLAWNVYADDYTGCGLIGKGSDGRVAKAGQPYIVGVVELDSMY